VMPAHRAVRVPLDHRVLLETLDPRVSLADRELLASQEAPDSQVGI